MPELVKPEHPQIPYPPTPDIYGANAPGLDPTERAARVAQWQAEMVKWEAHRQEQFESYRQAVENYDKAMATYEVQQQQEVAAKEAGYKSYAEAQQKLFEGRTPEEVRIIQEKSIAESKAAEAHRGQQLLMLQQQQIESARGGYPEKITVTKIPAQRVGFQAQQISPVQQPSQYVKLFQVPPIEKVTSEKLQDIYGGERKIQGLFKGEKIYISETSEPWVLGHELGHLWTQDYLKSASQTQINKLSAEGKTALSKLYGDTYARTPDKYLSEALAIADQRLAVGGKTAEQIKTLMPETVKFLISQKIGLGEGGEAAKVFTFFEKQVGSSMMKDIVQVTSTAPSGMAEQINPKTGKPYGTISEFKPTWMQQAKTDKLYQTVMKGTEPLRLVAVGFTRLITAPLDIFASKFFDLGAARESKSQTAKIYRGGLMFGKIVALELTPWTAIPTEIYFGSKIIGGILEEPADFSQSLYTYVKSEPYELIGGILGGLAAPKIRDIIRTVGVEKIPTEKIIEPKILTGEKIFPTAPPKTHLKEFLKSDYRLPNEIKPGGYHAAPQPIIDLTIGKGTSEIPGLYIAPSVSPHFLKLAAGGYPSIVDFPNLLSKYTEGLIARYKKPTVVYITPKKFIKGISQEPGVAGVPMIKSEIEAVLPPETTLISKGIRYYFEYKGRRVPISEYIVEGTKTKLPKITIKEISESYYLPSSSYDISPTYYPVSKVSRISAPSKVSSVSIPQSVINYEPKVEKYPVYKQPSKYPPYKLPKYPPYYPPIRLPPKLPPAKLLGSELSNKKLKKALGYDVFKIVKKKPVIIAGGVTREAGLDIGTREILQDLRATFGLRKSKLPASDIATGREFERFGKLLREPVKKSKYRKFGEVYIQKQSKVGMFGKGRLTFAGEKREIQRARKHKMEKDLT